VIAERLAKTDPGNAGWQCDLAVSYERIGDVRRAQGNLPEALKSYDENQVIAEFCFYTVFVSPTLFNPPSEPGALRLAMSSCETHNCTDSDCTKANSK